MKLLKSYVLTVLITTATIFSMTNGDIDRQRSQTGDSTASFSDAATTSGLTGRVNNLNLNTFDEEDSVFVGVTGSDFSPRTLQSMIRPSKKPSAVELSDFNNDEEDEVSFAMNGVVSALKILGPTLAKSSQENVEEVDAAANLLMLRVPNILEATQSLENILVALHSQYFAVSLILGDLKKMTTSC